MHNYKELKVWNLAMDFTEQVYSMMEKMPKREMFSLTSQIKRSAVSIPSNIAEGAGRSSDRDFLRFIHISNGSANELETQLILAQRFGYLP